MGGMAPVKMDPEMPPPSYEPPVPVEPTTMAYPAVRPMSVSKQTQEHSGRVATPPRDSYTPVDTDGMCSIPCLFCKSIDTCRLSCDD